MHALCSKVVLVFNFPPLMLNLILIILPKIQLQSHGLRYFSNKNLYYYFFKMNLVGFKVGKCTRSFKQLKIYLNQGRFNHDSSRVTKIKLW